METYEERCRYYLKTEAATKREVGNGRAEVFHEIAKLALGSEPPDDAFLTRSVELIDARHDCADFALAGVLRLLYRYRDHALLSAEMRQELERTTLEFCYWYDQPGIAGMCFHTENHQILFHSCEILAGQLFPDTVFANSSQTGRWHAEHGATRAKEWLEQRARFGFSEWLSNCYFEEDLLALLNLYDFAEDKEIRETAGKLVSIVLLELALHSFNGVLATTHGRTYARWIKTGRFEPTAQISWLLFGQGSLPAIRNSSTNFATLAFATSDYRCPELISAVANDRPEEILLRERHGLAVAEAASYGLEPDDIRDNMFFWACQTSRHPDVRGTTLNVARIADHDWLINFVRSVDKVDGRIEACRALIEETGADFDGDVVNTALSPVNIITFRTPDYQLSCAQDFRPGKPGYQQHPWHAVLGVDAVVFTNHPGTDDEANDHLSRPNFWAGNRWLPRAAQHRNVLVCIHHVPADDPRPYSHAWFPKAAFDEVVQEGHWVLARKGDGYVALYSQTSALWAASGEYANTELRADARDNIWLCELGNAQAWGSFEAFCKAVLGAEVVCEGLRVAYASPSLGQLTFGWNGPLQVNGEEVPLHGYPRFDAPYIRTAFGERDYTVCVGDEALRLEFSGEGTKPRPPNVEA